MASTDQPVNGTDEPPRKRRQRARQACIPCRQRKRKCDANYPCDMCTTYGYECNFPEDRSPVANYAVRGSRQQQDARPDLTTSPSGRHHSIQSPHTNDSHQTPKDDDEPDHDPGIIELDQSRYMASSSSAAFALSVGQELQSSAPPKLHPFGYTFGLRPEEKAEVHGDLCQLISRQDVERYASNYFTAITPVFDIIDPQEFYKRFKAYYDGFDKNTVFAAIIAGVVANASYMAPKNGHAKELEIVQYNKRILDDPESVRKPSIDLVVACVLRLMYLRASSSPNTAWLSCCTTMHLCEANGLHDENIVRRLAQVHAACSGQAEDAVAERYRRLYWTVWASNVLTAYEFGRTPVVLPTATVADPVPSPGNYLHQQVQSAKTIPKSHSGNLDANSTKTPLHTALASLIEVPADHNFIKFTKADMACAYYRRMRQQRLNITTEVIEQMLKIGDAGLEAAAQCCKARQPWFNAFGSTFQYTCVLIAIDKSATLASVGRAVQVLEMFVDLIDTAATREALSVARLLLRDSTLKKKRELAMLEAIDTSQVVEESAKMSAYNNISEQTLDFGLNWDQLFDNVPYFDSNDLFKYM